MKPGTTYAPSASSVSTPSYAPSPAMTPSEIAMSTSSHSRVKTESTRPPRTTRSAGSSPRATASRRARSPILGDDTRPATGRIPFAEVQVLTPRSLPEALRLKAEHPGSVPIQGGTDVMVELNFDRARPAPLLNLNEVGELRGSSRENGTHRLGSAQRS